MELKYTEQLMADELAKGTFGDYALLVYKGGDEAFISSANVDEDTYFDIASMGKVLITSALILRGAGEGRFSLDDTLDKFFADVPDDRNKITVRQLLTHTSGIVRFELPDEAAGYSREQQAKLIIANPLKYAPGSDYTYSCNGYILLGFIAEIVYGEMLDKLYFRYIKPSLGLTRSTFNIAGDEPNAVVSYSRREMGEYRADDRNVRILRGIAGNGASFWTAADIRRYIDSVFAKDGKLYAPELHAESELNYTPNFSEGRGLGYLYVTETYKQTGRLFPVGSFGHCGHTGTSFFMNRELDMFVILLTNTTRYSNIRSGFKGYDYGDTIRMRERVHNAIADDLFGKA